MASLSFSYRSTKPKAFLEMRFAYRIEGENIDPKTGYENPISFYTRSEIEVEKSYWKNYKKKSNDPIIQEQKNDLDAKMIKLRTVVLNEFEKTEIENISKEWFLNVVNEYYHPKDETEKPAEIIPSYLVDYFAYYLEARKHEMKQTSILKYNVIKKKLQRFEASINTRFKFKDINEKFKKLFVEYYKSQNYSKNTMQRELVFIKTVCKHAKGMGIETHPQMETLKLEKEKVPKIWLTFQELEEIGKLKDLLPHLENAKDWLIISCYTGQRVSDFMRFTSEMVRTENGNKLLEFTQKKTDKNMTVPLHKKVLEVLDRRDGEFPHAISDQKYNDYIKEVCKLAKINQLIEGKISKNIEKDEKKKKKIRRVFGTYPKYELISSHVGRRSFSTNFYGTIPTTYLINVTGHGSEAMFLNYIGKSNKDLAMEIINYF